MQTNRIEFFAGIGECIEKEAI